MFLFALFFIKVNVLGKPWSCWYLQHSPIWRNKELLCICSFLLWAFEFRPSQYTHILHLLTYKKWYDLCHLLSEISTILFHHMSITCCQYASHKWHTMCLWSLRIYEPNNLFPKSWQEHVFYVPLCNDIVQENYLSATSQYKLDQKTFQKEKKSIWHLLPSSIGKHCTLLNPLYCV